MNTNTHNLAQRTNIMAGSPVFNLTGFYLQSISLPGVSFSHPEIGGRNGARFTVNSDTVTYGDLSFTILADEKFLVYEELMNIVRDQIDIETGEFTQKVFDLWITVTDNLGNDVMKWDFKNAKIESIGDIQYDYSDEETSFTIDMTLKFDTFTYKNLRNPSILPTLKV